MNCPQCGHKTTSVNRSEPIENGTKQSRTRECEDCELTFTTHEEPVYDGVQVKKRGGEELEEYDREKLRDGIEKAVTGLEVSDECVDELIVFVEDEIDSKESDIVSSDFIGQLVADRLLEIDGVAFMRFVSVFKGFSKPEQFEEALQQVNDTESESSDSNDNPNSGANGTDNVDGEDDRDGKDGSENNVGGETAVTEQGGSNEEKPSSSSETNP